jgi:hypothetical protein
MKLVKPDTTSTEIFKSKSFDFKAEFRNNLTLRELSDVMSMTDEPVFEQNRFIVSMLLVKIVTELTDENDKIIKGVPRSDEEQNGVQLLDGDFLEMLPPQLFMEMADHCMTKALSKLSGDDRKN